MKEFKAHQRTNEDGNVLILKVVDENMQAYEGFVWPKSGEVIPTSWDSSQKCGGGLHGWPWGIGIGDGKSYRLNDDIWIVFSAKPENVVGDLEGGQKCKAKTGTVVYAGNFAGAWAMVAGGRRDCLTLMATAGRHANASTAGDNANASTAGGNANASTAGDNAHASTAGDNANASTAGDNCVSACLGIGSRAKAGQNGSLILTWHDGNRIRHVVAYVGENGIKENTWYVLDESGIIKEAN